MNDLISIVIPVYNGEQFLRGSLNSLINQTYDKLEIIYVCDGCTDSTVDILRGYAKSDARIKIYVRQERRGVAVSRNIGKKLAKGEWLIFLDCDDLFESNMIEVMHYWAIKEGADMCCCFWEEFIDKPALNTHVPNAGLKQYSTTYPSIDVSKEEKYILQLVHHCPWNKLIHRTIYQKQNVFFQDIPNCNDAYFSFISAIEATKIVYVDEIFIHYRGSAGRNTISESRKNTKNYVWEAYDQLYQYIDQRNNNENLKQSFYNRVCNGVSIIAGWVLYEDLYNNLFDIYLAKWGMCNPDIQKKLSYFNQEIYKKLCIRDLSMNIFLIREEAKKYLACSMIEKDGCSIWGCGHKGRNLLEGIGNASSGFKHFYDSDPNKWGMQIAGKTVERFSGEWADYIIVTSSQYYEEIRKQIDGKVGHVIDLETEIYRY